MIQGGIIFLGFLLLIQIISYSDQGYFSVFHKIQEGYVGVYYKYGILQEQITNPGFNLLIPFITRYEMVQTSVQTDQITNIECGTSGGVMLYFDKIEVVNQLKREYVYETLKTQGPLYDKIWIYDKIHHEINTICSKNSLQYILIEKFENLDEMLMQALQKDLKKWVPGLEILSIRVTKPNIPQSIKQNYEKIESTKTKILILQQQQKLQIQAKEAKKKQAIQKMNGEMEILHINISQELSKIENQLKVQKIENDIQLQKEKGAVDSEYYKDLKELETIQNKLSDGYMKHQIASSLTSNLDLIVGNRIPQILKASNLIN